MLSPEAAPADPSPNRNYNHKDTGLDPTDVESLDMTGSKYSNINRSTRRDGYIHVSE